MLKWSIDALRPDPRPPAPWRCIPTEIAQALTEVAANTYRLRLPMAFPTQSVNAYILRYGDGAELIDTGDQPEKHATWWTAAFRHLGIHPGTVRGIYVTHHHSDHIGSARYLQDLTGAPVFMLDRELEEARRSGDTAERHRTELLELLIHHGMPADLAREWRSRLGPLTQAKDLPELTPLQDGQTITLGGDACKTIWTPGHADGQYCLYNPSRRLLFGADHLLRKMPPPLLHAPRRRPSLVTDYLDSLAKVVGLDASLILPGHGAAFSDLGGHVQEMTHQVEQRLSRILEALATPTNAYALIPVLYPRITHLERQRYVLTDIVSYLEHLVSAGRAVRRFSEMGTLVYEAAL